MKDNVKLLILCFVAILLIALVSGAPSLFSQGALMNGTLNMSLTDKSSGNNITNVRAIIGFGNITCLNKDCTRFINATDGCDYYVGGGRVCGS